MQTPIVDIHCDLLSYLAESEGHSVEDKPSRCSYPDLVEGGVRLQTLAIFTKTGKNSIEFGKKQVHCFLDLVNKDVTRFTRTKVPLSLDAPLVQVIPAFENASSFADETESFDEIVNRLEGYLKVIGPIFYIGLTWDEENRFGGGNRSSVGLKKDGERLLEFLSGKRIAIDLSHTSDALAHGIINWIDKRSLEIPLIASHSNFRALSNYPRNLSNELAKELIARKGLIGLNFFAPFIHDTDPSVLTRHVEYGLALGGHEALCFGADFFFVNAKSVLELKQKYGRNQLFYEELGNASVYPSVLRLFQDKIGLKKDLIEKIAFQNASSFLNRLVLN